MLNAGVTEFFYPTNSGIPVSFVRLPKSDTEMTEVKVRVVWRKLFSGALFTRFSDNLKSLFQKARRTFASLGIRKERNNAENLGHKLRSGSFKKTELVPVQPDFPLFWKSDCVIGTFRPLNSILCVSTSFAFCVLILSAVWWNLLALIVRLYCSLFMIPLSSHHIPAKKQPSTKCHQLDIAA